MASELEVKTDRLQRMLVREGLGGVLINSQHNFAWATGGASNGIDLSRDAGAASVLVTAEGKRYILANNIEMGRMLAEEVSADDLEPVEYRWQDEKARGSFVLETARSLVTGGTVVWDNAIEAEIAKCRYGLTPDELVRYERLGSDAAEGVRQLIYEIEPGESESEIAAKLRNRLAICGMTSVVTLVAADERISKYRHPIPSNDRWEKLVLLVTCAKRGGLIVSLSRMVCVGDVPAELQRRTDAAALVHASLLDATRPGLTGRELYDVAASAYSRAGFAGEIDRHHQGGAAGYRTRDWVAHPESGEVVQDRQAFAWNPSVTGTKVEETCVVSGGVASVITRSPSLPTISTVIGGKEYLSPGIIML